MFSVFSIRAVSGGLCLGVLLWEDIGVNLT